MFFFFCPLCEPNSKLPDQYKEQLILQRCSFGAAQSLQVVDGALWQQCMNVKLGRLVGLE